MLRRRAVQNDPLPIKEVRIGQYRYVEHAAPVHPRKPQIRRPNPRRPHRRRNLRHTRYQRHRQNPQHPRRYPRRMGNAVNALRQQYPRYYYPGGHQYEHQPRPPQGNPPLIRILIRPPRPPAVHEPHPRQIRRQDD